MRTRKLCREDLLWLRGQPGQKQLGMILDDLSVQIVVNSKWSYTVEREDGAVMLCGGLVEYWEGRAETWATFNKSCRKDFLAIHHEVVRFLDGCGIRRIEAGVDVNFEAGHRWAKALGFILEAPCMKAYLPNGVDCALYSRVR